MKIIDLLNKIANGEEPPKKIKYNKSIYEYYWPDKDYVSGTHWLFDEYVIQDILNDEVEILEITITYNPAGNKIAKIKSLNNVGNNNNLVEFEDKQQINNHILKDKINEIIDFISKEEE